MKMKIIRAEHLGMCFGVKDAIALALGNRATRAADDSGRPGPQRNRAGRIASQRDSASRNSRRGGHADGDDHRARRIRARINETRGLGLNVLEATCPLVHVAHRSLAKLVREGFHPVIIGKRDHVEVRGMTEDLDEFDVVLCEEDVEELRRAAALRRHCANHAAD